jgi:hypothetical protein
MALDSLETSFEGLELEEPSDEACDATDTSSPYCERVLQPDHIRLITIHREAGTLRLTVTSHKFQDDLEYDAVSYVWGTAEPSINVSCNGKSLVVTPTVFEMLRYLHPDRLYWLDSICINQQDTDEKAIQIPLMHRIYSRAAFVVIWMGLPTVQTESFIAHFTTALETTRRWNAMLDQNLQPWIQEPDIFTRDEHFWQGMMQICNHDWFKRLWTFQEAVLAKRPILLLGSLFLSFEEFLEFPFLGWFRPNGYIQSCLVAVGMIDSFRVSFTKFWTFREYRRTLATTGVIPLQWIPVLFWALRGRQVKEPVDRAWAITGLFSNDLRSELHTIVDYSDKGRAEFWRTHIEFAKTIMVVGHTLDLLRVPPTVGKRADSIPSWCPTLDGTSKSHMIIEGQWVRPVSASPHEALLEEAVQEKSGAPSPCDLDTLSSMNASRSFISFEKNDNYLRTCGFMVDVISEIVHNPELEKCEDYTYGSEDSRAWTIDCADAGNLDFHVRGLSLARRMFYGTLNDGNSVPPLEYLMALLCDERIPSKSVTAFGDAWTVFLDPEHADVTDLPFDRQRLVMDWLSRLRVLTGHFFFSTTGGRFGVATSGCKPGDKVCVFYNEPPLHILRWPGSESETESSHGDGPAEFCGVAFVPHLMKRHEQEAARLGPNEIFVIG